MYLERHRHWSQKRFVQTVINDQIPESIVSLVKEQKEHFQVERLKFIGSSVKGRLSRIFVR